MDGFFLLEEKNISFSKYLDFCVFAEPTDF